MTFSAGGPARIERLDAAFDHAALQEFAPLHLAPGVFHPALERICAASKGKLALSSVGASAEGRPIFSVSTGSGPLKVFLWSQMHGDESTATRALGDILRHLSLTRDEPATQAILANLSILALPMLNPDGAERCTRRTARGIDMNRDAVARQTPEAALLTGTAGAFKPIYSFNLHDQELSTVAAGPAVTAMAFLAPAFDASRGDNPSRSRAKRLASYLAAVAGEMAPGRIARYDDAFEPRAFGDTFQREGFGTVLIESGHAKDDPRKASVRKMNFVAILAALEALAEGEIDGNGTEAYDTLPPNGKRAYDVIVRGVTITGGVGGAGTYKADLGISRQVDTHPEGPPRLVDAGDLSTFTGLEDFNGAGKSVAADELALNRPFDYERLLGR